MYSLLGCTNNYNNCLCLFIIIIVIIVIIVVIIIIIRYYISLQSDSDSSLTDERHFKAGVAVTRIAAK